MKVNRTAYRAYLLRELEDLERLPKDEWEELDIHEKMRIKERMDYLMKELYNLDSNIRPSIFFSPVINLPEAGIDNEGS